MPNRKTTITFRLEQDGEGYPPFSSEEMLAKVIEDDVRRIISSPLFVPCVAFGDLVRIEKNEEGEEVYVDTLNYSGAVSISIIVTRKVRANRPATGHSAVERLLDALNQHSQFYRTMRMGEELHMVGASFSSVEDYEAMIPFFEKMKAEGYISYEELCLPR
jgi:Domain of unknown function (DUF4265)